MSQKNSNQHLTSQKVSDEDMAKFSLSEHLVDFLWNEPFYSRILRSLNKVESTHVPTAGVSAVNGELTLWWNRRFMAGLSKKQVRGLLKHECLHLVFGHTTERRKDPHIIWNYGTDLAINSTIPESELPEGGLIPGNPLIITEEQKLQMSPEHLENFMGLSDLISKMPRNKTSEYYFNRLISDPKSKEFFDQMEASGEAISVGFDDHDGWDDIPDEDKEMIQGKIKEIVKDAANEANNRNWGSISSALRQEINRLISKEIKWESLLKRFCGFSRKNERINSIRRLNKKYPGVHSGFKKNYKPSIAVYIDESGSVSNNEIERFYAELDNLSRQTDFHVYKFDTRVDESSSFHWKKNSRPVRQRNLMGGTCFNSVTKHAIKNKKTFDGYIVLTDGGAPKPDNSIGIKRCWVLASNCELAFNADRSDIVINMK
jgi:predicted metal-dependent peptidase